MQVTSDFPLEKPTTPDGWQTNLTVGREEANGREAEGPVNKPSANQHGVVAPPGKTVRNKTVVTGAAGEQG